MTHRWNGANRLRAAATIGALLACTGVLAYPVVLLEGVTINEPGVYEGLVLVPYGPQLRLLEPDGTIVHRWNPQCGSTFVQRPLANGNLLIKTCTEGPGSVRGLVELEWDGTIVWRFPTPPGIELHHDWDRLPNGNTIALAQFFPVSYPNISPVPIIDDYIYEIDPLGNLIWEWHLNDHFNELNLSQARLDDIATTGLDWAHSNTVNAIPEGLSHTDPRFRAGNLIVSLRHQGLIVIDRATDQIVWHFFGDFLGQHQTYMIPPGFQGAGNIMIFDNGWAGPWAWVPNRYYSRVIELNPETELYEYVYDAEDSGYPLWNFRSWFAAGAERLPNGNTFVAEGSTGRLFEVLPTGQLVWEYVNGARNPNPVTNNSNEIYRAYKVPYAWAGTRFESDLQVSGSHSGDPVLGGGTVQYTIQITNNGPEPAVNPQVSGTTPAGTHFQSIVPPAGWNCTTPAVGSGGMINCTRSKLSTGEGGIFTLDLGVDVCVNDGGVITLQPTVSADGTELVPGDNSVNLDTVIGTTNCPVDGLACTVDGCSATTNQCAHEPVACVALDPCHDPGICDLATGVCSNPPNASTGVCDDGDITTCADVCNSGTCAGTFIAEPSVVADTLEVTESGGTATISWSDAPGEFNVYRGVRALGMPFAYNHGCLNPAGPITATTINDATVSGAGVLLYYLPTRVEQCRESRTGFDSAGTPRADLYSCPSPGPDTDSDGVTDALDNCPSVANASQLDTDADSLGDACDLCDHDPANDADGDGICAGASFDPPQTGSGDPCPGDAENDADNDGLCNGTGFVPPKLGDMDPCPDDPLNDIDADMLCAGQFFNPPMIGALDNCPDVANPDQTDHDGDGIGIACDNCSDGDNDGFGNPFFPTNTCPLDNCPATPNPGQENADGDAQGDVCDPCPMDPTNSCCTDVDGDGICDGVDNCPTVFNTAQTDTDGDGIGDACDI